MPRPTSVWLLHTVFVLIGSLGYLPAQTPPVNQPDVCSGDARLQGMPIRKVTIEARGGWPPSVHLPFGPGDKFDFPQLTQAQTTVSRAFSNDPLRDSVEVEAGNSLSFTFVSSCVTVVEGEVCGSVSTAAGANQCVDVAIKPISVRLGLSDMGSNAIPAPRSNLPTSYSQVPVLLRTFNPAFGIERDRRMGVYQTARVSTDLLTLPSSLRGEVPDGGNVGLNLDLQGNKSLDERFYETDSDLSFEQRRTGKFVEAFSVFTGFSANQQPLDEGRHYNNAVRAGGAVTFRPASRAINALTLAGNYRGTSHDFVDNGAAADQSADENAFDGRALLDGRIGDGTWRAAVWLEANHPTTETLEPYRRFALLGGYQSEIGRTEQTVGLEILAGAGRAWGRLPAYARFYGGTGLGNFLYEARDAPAMRTFPVGPLLRSFGRGEAAAGGASGDAQTDAYWHVNLNLTFPIPRLSCPLIPPVALFDDVPAQNAASSPCKIKRPQPGIKTLKDAINGMVVSGENFLAADIAEELVEEGLDPDVADKQAAERAAKVFGQIRPAMRFITEKANLYAVKPLFMLDVGRIATERAVDQLVRVSVGGGVQMSIAIARFELGYLRSVRRFPADPRGNFIGRLFFQNLF
jgi:hypothetical protein